MFSMYKGITGPKKYEYLVIFSMLFPKTIQAFKQPEMHFDIRHLWLESWEPINFNQAKHWKKEYYVYSDAVYLNQILDRNHFFLLEKVKDNHYWRYNLCIMKKVDWYFINSLPPDWFDYYQRHQQVISKIPQDILNGVMPPKNVFLKVPDKWWPIIQEAAFALQKIKV